MSPRLATCLAALIAVPWLTLPAAAQHSQPLGRSKACPAGLILPDTTVVSAGVDAPLQLRAPYPSLRYPPGLRDQRRGGEVVLDVVVEADGSVHPCDIQLITVTDSALIAPALDFVRAARFNSPRQAGRPVRCRARVPVKWSVL